MACTARPPRVARRRRLLAVPAVPQPDLDGARPGADGTIRRRVRTRPRRRAALRAASGAGVRRGRPRPDGAGAGDAALATRPAVYTTALLRTSRTLLLASILLYPVAVLSKENVIAVPAVAAALTLLVRRTSWPLIRQISPWYAIAGLVAVLLIAGEVVQPHEPIGLGELPTAESRPPRRRPTSATCTSGARSLRATCSSAICWSGWSRTRAGCRSTSTCRRHRASSSGPRRPGSPRSARSRSRPAFCCSVADGPASSGSGSCGHGSCSCRSWPRRGSPSRSCFTAAIRGSRGHSLPSSCSWARTWAARPCRCCAPPQWGSAGSRTSACSSSAPPTPCGDDAVRKNRAVERRAPGAFRPYLNRGQVLLQAGRLDPALEDFAVALELRPGLAYAHFNRALAYVRQGRYDQALTAFDEGFACAAGPGVALARAHSSRARLYRAPWPVRGRPCRPPAGRRDGPRAP